MPRLADLFFQIIVLLHNLSALELQHSNWWLNIQSSWFHQLQQFEHIFKQQSSLRDHTATTMLDCCSFLKFCVTFKPDATALKPSKKFLRKLFSKVLGIITMFFFLANVRQAFVFFFGQQCFSSQTLPCVPCLPILFLTLIMNPDLNWGKWDLQFCRCYSDVFWDLLHCRLLGVILVGLAKVHHCSRFFHL